MLGTERGIIMAGTKKELVLNVRLPTVFSATQQYKSLCSATTRRLYSHYKPLVVTLQNTCSHTTNTLVAALQTLRHTLVKFI